MTWLYVPCISALDTEALSLPSEESPAPWLTLSGTATQRPLSWRGWQRRDWIKLLSGMTSPRSTVTRGVDAWISSLPVSPVSPSLQQERSWDLTMTGGSGPTSNGSSVRYDPDSCSWKTCQALFEQDYPLSSIPLPSSGSMRNGVCTPRPTLEPRTDGNGSGSLQGWATPRAVNPPRSSAQGTAGPTLMEQAVGRDGLRLWLTPMASDGTPSSGHRSGARSEESSHLRHQAKIWPTPLSRDFRQTSNGDAEANRRSPDLPYIASRHAPTTTTDGPSGMVLNPRFVEALLGLPEGWSLATPFGSQTVCTCSETAWCRKLHARLGSNSLGGLHD